MEGLQAPTEQKRWCAAAWLPGGTGTLWLSYGGSVSSMMMVRGIPTVPFKEESETPDFGRRTLRGYIKTSKIFVGLLCGREIGIVHEKGKRLGPRAGCYRETHLGSIETTF